MFNRARLVIACRVIAQLREHYVVLWLTLSAASCVHVSPTDGMAIVPERKMFKILEINRELTNWTVRVQVVERHREQTGKGSNGKSGKRYRRYVLVDEQGTKVSGIVYEDAIRFFERTLLPFKRYDVSNAKLLEAVSFFKVGPYSFTWVFDYNKLVEPVDEQIPPFLPVTYPVRDFTDFFRHADLESYFNVKALVIHAMPRRQVNKKSSQREIVIIDQRKIPMIMTLWDDFGDVEGLQLAHALPGISLIIATNVKATTFHGLSLSTRMFSYFLINPPLTDKAAMLEWYQENMDEITTLLKKEAYRDVSILYPPPAETDTITVSDALSALPLRKTAWVIGKPRFIPTTQKYWIHACQACKKRLDIPMEWVIKCSKCGEASGVEVRSRIPIQLADGGNVLSVTLKSPDVELLTGITPQQLKDSEEFGLRVEEELKIELDKLMIVCFLKKQGTKDQAGTSVESNRYVAIKAYNALDVKNNVDPHAVLTEIDAESTQPAEKQFFTPTASKLLKEIQDEQTVGQISQPSPSAKRNIDFVTPPIRSEKAVKGAAGESAVSNVVHGLLVPAKHEKGKSEEEHGATRTSEHE